MKCFNIISQTRIMKFTLPLIALFAISFLPQQTTAQQNSPKTLLWRISGNGMAQPSYLYGTMHLKDRRLFFFGDSVYKSIEASQGFAMELDPAEMMDSVFSKIGEADTTTLLRKLLDEKKFKSVAKKLEKKFGMPADKISRKRLIDDRENWYYNIHKKDDMKTVVDLYLYDIANKQGKWVGGIEDINDQLGIKDELGKDINIEKYVDDDDDEKKKEYLEKMIRIYTDQDLDMLDKWVTGSQSKNSRDLLLVNRNIKMASRMDSLAHIRNSFFAVGAAHLPGETGLIVLLQKKGFTVTPVISSQKIIPEKYVYTAREIPWIKFAVEDSAYTVEMPGKATDLKMPVADVKFKVFADLVTNTAFMTGFTFFSSDENPEEMKKRMLKSFLAKGFEKKEERKISNKGISGIEVLAERQNVYYRIQIFTLADKLFMAMTACERRENLLAKDAERFFQSFTMNASLVAKPNNWSVHTDREKAFEISFPKKPGIDKLKESESDKNFETTAYTLLDVPNNTYYMLVVSDTKKGFVISDDSLVLNGRLNFYKESGATVTDIRNFNYDENKAVSYAVQTTQDGLDYVTKMVVVCRGNRSYTIAVVTQKGKEDYLDVSRFFKSFKLTPYKENTWAQRPAYNNEFNTWAPSLIKIAELDSAALANEKAEGALEEPAKEIQLIAHEPYSVTNYNINIYPVSKYYQAKSDSIFFAEQLQTYYSDSTSYHAKENPGNYDSIIYKRNVTNGNVKGVEILVKNAAKSYFKRVRILPHGDSAYHLFAIASLDILTNIDNNRFFEEFRFLKENLPSKIADNKTSVILSDLKSIDSLTKVKALNALNSTNFESLDLPLLYRAYLQQYPVDSSDYLGTNERLGNAINKVHDSSTVSFVKENYRAVATHSPELKFDMLKMLASQKTKQAVLVIKELLLTDLPEKGSAGSFIYNLRDSLSLAAVIFPEAAGFFSDSLLGPGMISLATDLIDSNLLHKAILQEHQSGVLFTANKQLLQLKKDKDDYPAFNNYIIDALQKMNSTQANGVLNGFTKCADLYIKQNSLLALLKNNQAVAVTEIQKVAAERGFRTTLYDTLSKLGKQQLFPVTFLTQPSFAESYIYNNASDDEESLTLKLIGERVALINGIQQRFYLYKITFDYDGEPESYLAICGKFDINKKKVVLKDEDILVKVFYDEKFTTMSVNKQFNEFVKDNQKDKQSEAAK